MTPSRIQRTRAKGWRMPPGVVYVGRGSKWGNPFRTTGMGATFAAISVGGKGNVPADRQKGAVALYVAWLSGSGIDDPIVCMAVNAECRDISAPLTVAEIRAELVGKTLCCWCAPGSPCHADVLLELANGDHQ
jgi:hypothetical protein